MPETANVFIFLGRFHPLVVHLPIGFVCIAILVEIFFQKSKHENLQTLVTFIWLLAALSSTASVALGYFLSLQGGYDEQTLSLHKWSGIFLAVIIHACYFLKKYQGEKQSSKYVLVGSWFVCGSLLIVTGHFGGSLTHGSNYLTEYQPESFSELFGLSGKNETPIKKITSLDSADIFMDAVQPILNSKCVSCHNPKKKKGGLVLSSFDDISKGGEDGPAIVAGNLEKSGIYSRITLPEDDKKFMPANGKKPLTKQQVAIIKWWIEKQAPQHKSITALQPDSLMQKVFTSFFVISENSNVIDLTPPPANPTIINDLRKQGFIISTLSEKSNLLQASLNNVDGKQIDISKLAELKNQLVWLHITNAGKLGEALKTIDKVINLRKLTLTNSEMSYEDLKGLSSLSSLEYLNLYGSKLPTSVEPILSLKKLKELYIGKTTVDTSALNTLITKYPSTKIYYREPANELPTTDSLSKEKLK